MNLLNGDCLEKLKDLSKNSVDIIIADLPYGRFKHLEWDKKIDFEPLWEQLWRVSKPTTPIFLFGDFKFCMEIYNSQPKYFKYEIVWNKKTTTTPLLSRKRFGKCTEYILIFYKKQPVYNYAKYHKIIKKEKKYKESKSEGVVNFSRDTTPNAKYYPKLPLNIIDEKREMEGVINWKKTKIDKKNKNNYNPKLPCNIIEEEIIDKYKHLNHRGNKLSGKHNTYEPKLPTNIISSDTAMGSDWCNGKCKRSLNVYDPRLPLNIIEENEVVFSPMVIGKNNNMYHSKSGKCEPRLPINIIEKEEKISDDWNGGKYKSYNNHYEPALPCNVISCNSKRNKKTIKKLTEKPQFVLKHLLKYFSNEGDTCLDFCMGSGSMGIACIDLKRKFIGIEKNKEFFDITKERLLTKMTKNE